MGKEEIFDTLKDGVSLAGRMAARGVGEVSRALKPSKEARGQSGESGLYYQRHLHPIFGHMIPVIEFLEVQQPRRFFASVLKNLAIPAAERAFVAGYQALLRGNLREARDKFSEAFTKDAQFADAYFLHGAVSLELEDYGDAVHSFKKVLLCQQKLGNKLRKYLPSLRLSLCLTENSSFAIYPDLLGVSTLLSIAHRGNGDDDDAGTVLDQLLGVMPDNAMVGFFLSLHYVEAGRWRDVIALLKDTLPDDNISLANLILLARACINTGDPETALEIFKKIITRTDFDPQLMIDVRYSMGTALATMGRNTEAEEEFNRITTMYPGYMDVLERLGIEAGGRKKGLVGAPGSRAAAAIPVAEERPPARGGEEPRPGGWSEERRPPRGSEEGPPAREAEPSSAPPPQAPSPPRAASTAEIPEIPPAAPPPLSAPTGAGLALVSLDGKVSRPLGSGDTVIGREEGDVVIGWDNAASRRHAHIRIDEGSWWVEDLGSTNGTFVNGHKIGGRVLLNRGDVVTVGQTQFRIQ
jgi:tetratricopeptide (TPR) repeat protein